MERQDYIVEIYKKDRRYKDGERICRVVQLENETAAWVNLYVDSMRSNFYTQDKYRLVLKPKYVTVRSLMTGRDVQIDSAARGTVCDPSQERFWSM